MRQLCALVCCSLLADQLLDRVAVTVGTQVITETELMTEIRLNGFLNDERQEFTAQTMRAAADRLIEQKLVKKEMEAGSYPPASAQEAGGILDNLIRSRAHGVSTEFDSLLRNFDITLEELKAHLVWGLTLAHFVDVRFRPAVQVSRKDVNTYFEENVLPNSRGATKPDMESMRSQIEQTLAAQRSDQQLDAWLKDTRAHTRIVYRKEVFGLGSGEQP